MFITHRLAEIEYDPALRGADQQGWSYLEKRKREPWFHVTTRRPNELDAGPEEILIDSSTTLKAFLETFDHSYQLASIRVVTPGLTNGTGDWKMEPLTELCESSDGVSLRYTVPGDRQYFFPSSLSHTASDYTRKLYPMT